jgi:UDP-glucuronate 4-epimerase
MRVLVTGAAGFIGLHACEALLARGDEVVGLDNLNDYYSVQLKRDRLARLQGRAGFRFVEQDLADESLAEALAAEGHDAIVHLAAQAGVRWSLEAPFAYGRSNLTGQLVVLEAARRTEGLRHLVYASSSSVYGANEKMPFSIDDPADHPVSLYAATKRSGELLAQSYAHLYRVPCTGLRFFTVYGPWYRPDMALYKFADAMREGRPIQLYNEGRMKRDFTFVDDVAQGVLAALDRPPTDGLAGAPHRVYNLGNDGPVELLHVIDLLEQALDRKAERVLAPMQPGDVPATWADIEATRRDLDWAPTTPIEEGIPRFAAWYHEYHGA